MPTLTTIELTVLHQLFLSIKTTIVYEAVTRIPIKDPGLRALTSLAH